MAGGRGSRLLPHTAHLPKPLVPIADDCSTLDVVMHQLARQQFSRVTIAAGYLGDLIRAHAHARRNWGLDVRIVIEAEPLGTIGPLLPLVGDLGESFLVINADTLTDLDFADLLTTHRRSGAAMTIATSTRQVAVDFGVVTIVDGAVIGFVEKPRLRHDVAIGVNALRRSALDGYRVGTPLDFDAFVADMLASGSALRTYSVGGYWREIGRVDDYNLVCREFAQMRHSLLGEPNRLTDQVHRGLAAPVPHTT